MAALTSAMKPVSGISARQLKPIAEGRKALARDIVSSAASVGSSAVPSALSSPSISSSGDHTSAGGISLSSPVASADDGSVDTSAIVFCGKRIPAPYLRRGGSVISISSPLDCTKGGTGSGPISSFRRKSIIWSRLCLEFIQNER